MRHPILNYVVSDNYCLTCKRGQESNLNFLYVQIVTDLEDQTERQKRVPFS